MVRPDVRSTRFKVERAEGDVERRLDGSLDIAEGDLGVCGGEGLGDERG